MLNPSACPYSSNRWLTVREGIYEALAQWVPTLAKLTLVLLLALGAVWLLQAVLQIWYPRPRRLRWYRLMTQLVVAIVLACLVVTSPPGVAIANRLLISLLPPDSGEAADAIVVLGRGGPARNGRTQLVTELWKAQRSPKIFASGSGDAVAMITLLTKQGIPEQALSGEECSRTTEENAQFTAAILQPQGVKRIVLVTDQPHMLRSFLTFQSLGFEVIPRMAPRVVEQLSYKQRLVQVYREYAGLVVYGLRGRFFDRSPSVLLGSQPTLP